MTPVHVRFTPDADELAQLKRTMAPCGLRPSRLWLGCVVGALWFALGAVGIWLHGLTFKSSLDVFQMCLGVAYALVYYVTAKRTLARLSLSVDPWAEVDVTIDDSGIVVTEPQALRIPWTDVIDVRDFGEAFVIAQRRGPSFPIFKRALPDRGMALWAALDAKLSARRYLVRSTIGPPTIYNRLAPAQLR